MLVSVIVNNYNYAPFLAEAIESALSQTYSPIEVLVVDDGSVDDSREIISSFGDKVTVILQENGGQSSTFNAGYARCSGDIVIFLDSDDYLFDDCVAAIVEKMRDPRISKCNGYLQVVNHHGRSLGGRIPRRLTPAGDYREATLKLGAAGYTHSYTSGNAWSRRFLDQIMPIPEDQRSIGPDGYLTMVNSLFGTIQVIDRPIGAYRVHGNNKGPMSRKFAFEDLKTILQSQNARMDYLSHWADRLGLQAYAKEWQRRDWRLVLMRYCLWSFDHSLARPAYAELALAPLRSGRNRFKGLAISLYLTLIWVLPTEPSLEMARRALGFSRI